MTDISLSTLKYWLLKLFRWISHLITLILSLLLVFFAYKAIPKTDTFYVVGAGFADPSFLDSLQHDVDTASDDDRRKLLHERPTLYAHRIADGTFTVLGYRRFTEGSVLAIDDEGYEKITIVIPSFHVGQISTFKFGKGGEATGLMSKGGSAWVSFGCTWRLTTGTVKVDAKSSRYTILVDANLEPAIGHFEDHCREKSHLIHEFKASALRIQELTNWLGRAGKHPYAESYR